MANPSFKLTGSNPIATVNGFVAVITTADFLNANADCLDGTKFTGGNLIVYADATKEIRYPIHVVKSVTGVSPDFLVHVRIPTYASAESIHVEADDVQTTQPVPSGTYGQYSVYQDIIGEVQFESSSTGASDVISVTPTIAGTSTGLPTNTTGQYGDNAWAFNGIDQDAGVSYPCGLDVVQPWTIKSNVKFDTIVAGTVWRFYNTAEDENLTLKIISGNWKISTAGLTPGDAGFGPTIGQWHTTHMVWDSSKLYLYIDGVLAYSVTPSLSAWQDLDGGFRVASSERTTDFLDGAISEFYTKQSAMSVEEIALEHANRSNPGTFWTASDYTGGGSSIDLEAGSLSLSGAPLSSEKHSQITLEQGAISYIGQSLDLIYISITNYEIGPEQGVISLIGNDIALNRTYQLILESGSLTYQGNHVSLTYAQAGSYDIDIDTGTLNLSGSGISFGFGKEISIDGGLISLNGASLGFNKASEIDLDTGSLSLTGRALTLDYSGFVSVIVDDFTLAYSSDTIGLSYTVNDITLNYK